MEVALRCPVCEAEALTPAIAATCKPANPYLESVAAWPKCHLRSRTKQ